MLKTVLFVTYGGGHAHMVTPVVRALAGDEEVKTVALALTTGGCIFAAEGLPYLGFKDFLEPDDVEATSWGKKLAAKFHSPASGIEEEEAIAYFGLCYWDLVTRYGEKEAALLWEEKQRHAFKPLTVLERVMDRIKPDMVVTTNSPRSEQAAIQVANNRGIPTMSMADLFGIHHFHPLESKYITVLSDGAIDNMLKEGVTLPREQFLVTGNPAFDHAFDYRGDIDYAWRKQHFPALPDDAKALLWIDMPAYWNLKKRELHIRSDKEILHDLETLSAAVGENAGYLLVRPHPSQDTKIYHDWMKTAPPHVLFAGTQPLYPLLKAVDVAATYTSTVGVEALLMNRRLIQLKYQPGRSDMPLGEWQMAWQANHSDELPQCVRQAFADDEEWARMQQRIARILPQEKAGAKVAECIRNILFSN